MKFPLAATPSLLSFHGFWLQNVGESLAEPQRYENLFPGYGESLKAEQFLKQLVKMPVMASERGTTNERRNLFEEMKQAEESGSFFSARCVIIFKSCGSFGFLVDCRCEQEILLLQRVIFVSYGLAPPKGKLCDKFLEDGIKKSFLKLFCSPILALLCGFTRFSIQKIFLHIASDVISSLFIAGMCLYLSTSGILTFLDDGTAVLKGVSNVTEPHETVKRSAPYMASTSAPEVVQKVNDKHEHESDRESSDEAEELVSSEVCYNSALFD